MIVDPATTALLVIDVQNYVLDPRNHPPRPHFYDRVESLVAPTLTRCLTLARQIGIEVVYTVMENLTADGRDRSLDYKLSGFNIAKGSWGAKVADEFAPVGDEIVLPKTSACLFNSTNADYVLRNMGIETILVSGFLTDQCVEQTMKAGSSRGYRVICIEDACATDTAERHQAALDRIASFGSALTANAVLTAMPPPQQ